MSDGAQLTDEVRALFDGPNYVHLATLRKDGTPRNWVVWAVTEGEHILVCTGDTSRKAKDMARNPVVALSVTDFENPYRMAAVQGRVVEIRDDSDGAIMDTISHTYTGKPFPIRGSGRVCFVIEPIKVGGADLPFEHRPG